MKTWDDVIKAAIGRAEPWTPEFPTTLSTGGDPILYQAVTLVDRGDLTREEALIQAVLALSQIRRDQHARIVDLLNHQPPAPFILP